MSKFVICIYKRSILTIDNIQLAQKIKDKLKEKNITISKLIEDCNLTKALIYDLEKRNSFLSSDRIFRISKYLNCSADYLLVLEEIEKKEDKNSKILHFENKNQAELLDMFNKLDDEYQKKAISQVFDLLIEMCRKQDEELNSKKHTLLHLVVGYLK